MVVSIILGVIVGFVTGNPLVGFGVGFAFHTIYLTWMYLQQRAAQRARHEGLLQQPDQEWLQGQVMASLVERLEANGVEVTGKPAGY